MFLTTLTSWAAAHYVLVRLLLAPRLVALSRHPPRRLRMVTLGSAFTAAMRMIHRIHGGSAYMRPLAEPSAAAGLADRYILKFDIASLPNRGAAFRQHHP